MIPLKEAVDIANRNATSLIFTACERMSDLEYDAIIVIGYKKTLFDFIKKTATVIQCRAGNVYWTGGELFRMKLID